MFRRAGMTCWLSDMNVRDPRLAFNHSNTHTKPLMAALINMEFSAGESPVSADERDIYVFIGEAEAWAEKYLAADGNSLKFPQINILLYYI